jgi:hypothetical protein
MDNTTNYLLKNVPSDLWIKFKKKALDEDANNYSEILIKLIQNYTDTNTLVANIAEGTYVSKGTAG